MVWSNTVEAKTKWLDARTDFNPSQDGNTVIIFVPAVFVVVVVADVEELACLQVASYSVQMAGSIEDSS